MWVNQGVETLIYSWIFLKQRLFDTSRQEWHGRLQESSRARFYRFVKPQYQLNKYLQGVTYKLHRMALSNFIMSSYCLCVETGEWRRPDPIPYETKYCALRRNKIEDEYHMLFECELYDELRNIFVPRYFRTRPSMFKLIELINSASNKQIRGLAKFVYKAFKIRSNLVWPTGKSHHTLGLWSITSSLRGNLYVPRLRNGTTGLARASIHSDSSSGKLTFQGRASIAKVKVWLGYKWHAWLWVWGIFVAI